MAESIGNNTIASRMRRFDNLVRGMGTMGLNAAPQLENDGEVYDPHYADEHVDKFQKNHSDHVDLVVSAAEIARREREDRIRERQRSDDHRNYASTSSITDEAYQQQKTHRFNKLPPGWLDCPAFGREIGCIVPPKVPLGESFSDAVGPGKRCSFRQVIHHLRVLSKKLGLVIDLTNTDRYYLKTDLKKEGIKHVKIACRGRDSVPNNESVNWFVYEVSQFLARQKPPKKYVLVHCTHGPNRTGYMIFHYHMRTEQITVIQEREDRIRDRQRSDDHRNYASHSSITDEAYQQQKKHRFNKLPPGWLDCPAFGREIGCIIPSKVPLGESFNDAVGPGKRYSFRQVIHHLRVLSKKLGLVIDLTNTDRYYLKTDLKREDIKHVKIACSGHNSVPDNESVNWFVYEVSQFLARQKPPKKYVLVHCTHGYNRTGYMIVHYLMRTEQITVTQALRRFAEARPPGIYKPDYIDALYSFYHEKKPYMFVCPSTPEWKRSSEFDLNGDSAALPQTSRTLFGNSAMRH